MFTVQRIKKKKKIGERPKNSWQNGEEDLFMAPYAFYASVNDYYLCNIDTRYKC